jgi:hypothetical protein
MLVHITAGQSAGVECSRCRVPLYEETWRMPPPRITTPPQRKPAKE